MTAAAAQRPHPQGKTPLSVVALQIVREALKPDASPTELSKLAESDPGFALRIISMVNSSAFGFSRKVTDVRHYTLRDGHVITFEARETPARGRETTFLQELLKATPGSSATNIQETNPGNGGGPIP